MQLFIFCVRDRATEAFGTPMFLQSSGQALRSFSDEVNRKAEDSQLYNHPDDFDLYECGSFDTASGVFDSYVPRVLVRGKDVSLKFVEAN